MVKLARVTAVDYLGGLCLRLRFSDGLVRELDFEGALEGPVFEPLNDPAVFAQVAVDQSSGTIVFPNGVGLDPEVLHGDGEPATGQPARVIAQYRLRVTG